MTDRDALIAAIHADPDDDTARLVYADWLQENGQGERADFIRAQIEAVRADPFGPQARKAAHRANELLDAHRVAWTRHLHGAYTERPRFERGFVTHLSIEPVSFVPRAEAIFDAEPIQALKLIRFAGTVGRASFQPLFELPRLRQLRRLELSSYLIGDEEEYRELFSCPYLSELRDLSLRENPVPPAQLAGALRGERFPHLAGLDLKEISNLGRCLAETFPGIEHRDFKRLDLSGVVFNSEQIQQVLRSRCLRQAEELRFGWVSGTGQEGPLFHLDLSLVIPWDRLVVLDLAGQRLGNEGVREITSRKEASTLRWLGLSHNGLGPDAVRYLTNSKYLSLNHLDVSGNYLRLNEIAGRFYAASRTQ